MITLNTNLASLIVQSNLQKSTNALNTAIERMTSGYKINGAKDNAANYSITTNMGVKITSYEVAEDNVAMGLDLLSTASENLDLISDKLTRLRALAEQAANGTYGEQSKKAINAEVNALVDEIERIYGTTEYNGIKLYGENGGSFLKKVEQTDTSNMRSLSDVEELVSGETYTVSTAEELIRLSNLATDEAADGFVFNIVLTNNIDIRDSELCFGSGKIEQFVNIDGNGYVISCGGFWAEGNNSAKNLGFEIFNDSEDNNARFFLNSPSNLKMDNCYIISPNSDNIYVGDFDDCYVIVSEDTLLHNYHGADVTQLSFSDYSELNYFCKKNLIALEVGIDSSSSSQIIVDTAFGLSGLNMLRRIGNTSMDYISLIDGMQNSVSSKQTEYGAVQNRLESALEEILTQYENLVSSRSTLRDADIAEVSSEYIRQQILQQASATLLATANQSPALALQLI